MSPLETSLPPYQKASAYLQQAPSLVSDLATAVLDDASAALMTGMVTHYCMQQEGHGMHWQRLGSAHVRNMMPWETPKPRPLICARFSDALVGGPSRLEYSREMLPSIWKADTWRDAEQVKMQKPRKDHHGSTYVAAAASCRTRCPLGGWQMRGRGCGSQAACTLLTVHVA
jgi:hypothetical protein